MRNKLPYLWQEIFLKMFIFGQNDRKINICRVFLINRRGDLLKFTRHDALVWGRVLWRDVAFELAKRLWGNYKELHTICIIT